MIKDRKTNESLQYAFIEFEQEEHCANAYFKMDNVLIDDRRIHVDFSQSVSKLKYADWRKRQAEAKGGGQQFVIKDRARKEYPCLCNGIVMCSEESCCLKDLWEGVGEGWGGESEVS